VETAEAVMLVRRVRPDHLQTATDLHKSRAFNRAVLGVFTTRGKRHQLDGDRWNINPRELLVSFSHLLSGVLRYPDRGFAHSS
jgi:hypothetical protein